MAPQDLTMVRTSSTTPSEDQARKGLVKVETSLENIRDDILSLKRLAWWTTTRRVKSEAHFWLEEEAGQAC